jgi:uncharacterized protein (TIGR02271 family)
MATPRNSGRDTGTTHLRPLGQLSDFEVANDSVDVRGWKVKAADDQTLGRVDDLLVDTELMTTRHLLVDLDKDIGRTTGKRVVIPVNRAHIDEDDRVVRVALSATDAGALTPFSGTIPADYDHTMKTTEPTRTTAPGPTGTRGAAGSERSERDVKRMTRSAEELRINRREVPAGEVRVKKDVDTEHVKQQVTKTREDVRVERRPASGSTPGRAEIREDEVRVPISEEELVVEKRPVVKEELVIAKERRPETETVEADVRKERVDVDRVGRPEDEPRRR